MASQEKSAGQDPQRQDHEQPTSNLEEGPDLGEAASPEDVKRLRLNEQIKGALGKIPGGEQLDKYFGITSGEPEQPVEEADRAADLIDQLRDAQDSDTQDGGPDLGELFGKISEHAAGSGADSDALRALMGGSRKPPSESPSADPPPSDAKGVTEGDQAAES